MSTGCQTQIEYINSDKDKAIVTLPTQTHRKFNGLFPESRSREELSPGFRETKVSASTVIVKNLFRQKQSEFSICCDTLAVAREGIGKVEGTSYNKFYIFFGSQCGRVCQLRAKSRSLKGRFFPRFMGSFAHTPRPFPNLFAGVEIFAFLGAHTIEM